MNTAKSLSPSFSKTPALYTISKRGSTWDLCRVPSGLVATVYYQNRAEDIRDALNRQGELETENAKLRAALENFANLDRDVPCELWRIDTAYCDQAREALA